MKTKHLKLLFILSLSLLIVGCKQEISASKTDNEVAKEILSKEPKNIYLKFIFNSKKPTFEELHLITSSENAEFPEESKQFEKLHALGFLFLDGEYYGIRNNKKVGDGVALWLIPIKEKNTNKNFDSILMDYSVLGNDVTSAELVKKVFYAFKDNFDVKILFEEKEIHNYAVIEDKIDDMIASCRTELNVEPGSYEALELVWGDMLTKVTSLQNFD